MLKGAFEKLAKTNNISTHSLRKTFGRRVYENNNESERALMLLSEIYNHTNLKLTRTYLGLKQQEIDDVYLNM